MIESDIQSLAPGFIIELFEFDGTAIGADILRWHNGVNQLGNNVVFDGEIYSRFPIEAEGFDKTTKGTIPRPILRLANVTGLISALARESNDHLAASVPSLAFDQTLDQ